MIDAEVLRLRKLRTVALRARALGKTLDSDCTQAQSVFARSAVICWTIARIASGRLRAHPYLSYQQGPSRLDDLADSALASVVAMSARRQNRRASVYAQQLQSVAREVDDVRALTWSPDLSDALGRMQIQMRRLSNELEMSALDETGATLLPRVKPVTVAESSHALGEMTDNSWPYLAI
ncbi:MAG TPA: hypothetical protein VGI32_16525 [Steroidobacteraceae bacterium]|jgi:hypothetical protein